MAIPLVFFDVLYWAIYGAMCLQLVLHILCILALEKRPAVRHFKPERITSEQREVAAAIQCAAMMVMMEFGRVWLLQLCAAKPIAALLVHGFMLFSAVSMLALMVRHWRHLRTMPEVAQ